MSETDTNLIQQINEQVVQTHRSYRLCKECLDVKIQSSILLCQNMDPSIDTCQVIRHISEMSTD